MNEWFAKKIYLKFESPEIAYSAFPLPGTLVKGPINYVTESVTGSDACAIITENNQEFGLVLVECLWHIIKYRIIGMLFVGQNWVSLTTPIKLWVSISADVCVWWCCDLWRGEPWYGRRILETAYVWAQKQGWLVGICSFRKANLLWFPSILHTSCLCLQPWIEFSH